MRILVLRLNITFFSNWTDRFIGASKFSINATQLISSVSAICGVV